MNWDYVSNDQVVCSVGLKRLWANTYGITLLGMEEKVDEAIWRGLLQQARDCWIQEGGIKLILRNEHKGHFKVIEPFLKQSDFKFVLERIEFRTLLADLPTEEGTPLTWKSLTEVKWEKEQIVETIRSLSIGDPEYDPNEDVTGYMEDWLNHPELTAGENCIRFGFQGESLVGMVVAQVDPKNGWSRLSYMAVHPAWRNKKMGRWVHRHGFQALREQGGILYHGGTSSLNQSMRGLFVSSGCQVFRILDEWHLDK